MQLRRLVKTNALHALRQNWSRAVGISLILMILAQMFLSLEMLLATVFHVPDFSDPFQTPQFYLDDLPNAAPAAVTIVGSVLLLRLFLLMPLRFGAQRWFYRAGDGRVEETFAVFKYFSSVRFFLNAVWLGICVILRSLFWMVIFLVPPGAIVFFARTSRIQAESEFQDLLSTGLEVAGILLFLLMVVFLVLFLMGYYLVGFALAENPEAGAGAVIRQSVQASRGHRGALFSFELSMIGWRFLDLLIIPRLFTDPYRITAQGLYAHFLFERSRRRITEKEDRDVAAAHSPRRTAAPDAEAQSETENPKSEKEESPLDLSDRQSEAKESPDKKLE